VESVVVDKSRYWPALIDYFYDNVFWSQKNISAHQWVHEEFGGVTHWDSNAIKFSNPTDATYFIMKWSGSSFED
jgi:hypothetical protein